jgi:hypothetical protein
VTLPRQGDQVLEILQKHALCAERGAAERGDAEWVPVSALLSIISDRFSAGNGS